MAILRFPYRPLSQNILWIEVEVGDGGHKYLIHFHARGEHFRLRGQLCRKFFFTAVASLGLSENYLDVDFYQNWKYRNGEFFPPSMIAMHTPIIADSG
jgi:hypothetical protein